MKDRSSSPRSASSARLRVGAGLALLGLGLVDQLDALFLQDQQELVELFRIDGVVGQVVVDLTVGQVAFSLPDSIKAFRPSSIFKSIKSLLT